MKYKKDKVLYAGSSYSQALKAATDKLAEMGGKRTDKGDMITKAGKLRVHRRPGNVYEAILYSTIVQKQGAPDSGKQATVQA